jgi:hypothetical protein
MARHKKPDYRFRRLKSLVKQVENLQDALNKKVNPEAAGEGIVAGDINHEVPREIEVERVKLVPRAVPVDPNQIPETLRGLNYSEIKLMEMDGALTPDELKWYHRRFGFLHFYRG